MGSPRSLRRETSVDAPDYCVPTELGDPDITGFGVLISFVASVVIVMITIVWAYIKDALPTSCYNEFDNTVLGRKNRKLDGRRVKAVQSLVLAMSDQQLVSGLAIVIAISLIRFRVHDLDAKTSAYAYSNAVYLAFLSCVIHLATIAALRDYLRDRRLLKHIRILIMVFIPMYLGQGILETWTITQGLTLRCSLARGSPSQVLNSDYLEGTVLKVAIIGSISIIFGVLAAGYIRRIRDLYTRDGREFPSSWQVAVLTRTVGWPATSKTELDQAKKRIAARLSTPRMSIPKACRLFFIVVPTSFTGSFMFEVVWLGFYFVFGILQVAFYLGIDHPGVLFAISFEPTFGQLLPLILILLPFLAMAEGYSAHGAEATTPISSTGTRIPGRDNDNLTRLSRDIEENGPNARKQDGEPDSVAETEQVK
ncbi:hypothetical protein QBC47DRAFT_420765 [Echria macrotheca]|uniref:Uncharacterized protein n=1 Tax=Echria macrotheca TaxID=438768 RepID=A0AAJ0BL31_9PEZI|nr:hypothetical protein QBC47DRAFT_420765 [Echria macrotheca]